MKLSDQITRRQLFLVAFGSSQQSGGLTSVDLAATRDENRVILTASDGSAAPVDGADAATAGVMTAADKTALDDLSAATVRAIGTRSEIASTLIGAGITHLGTAGYATEGDGGAARYKRVGSEPSHALKVQSADGAWWELVPGPGGISVRQAGAVGDDVTDDSQAFLDALDFGNYNASGIRTSTGPVIVPPGAYYLGSTTLQIKKATHLQGSGTAIGASIQPSILRWDANVTGIIMQHKDTIDATTEASGTGTAEGSTIAGLKLQGGGGSIASLTDDTKGHGIWLRQKTTLRDLSVSGFAGNGIHILATLAGSDDVKGNVNVWYMETARCTGNHMNGVYVSGGDVNAGRGVGVDVADNGRWGIHDSSFLGNTWLGCHCAGNGLAGKGENASDASSLVSFGGNRYAANAEATEAALVATEPGTDESVWLSTGSGGSSSDVPTWEAGQPEGTYFHGGDIRTDNINARNLFLGTYTEGNCAPPQLVRPTLAIGAHRGKKWLGNFYGFDLGSQEAIVEGPNWRFKNHQVADPDRDITLDLNPVRNCLAMLKADGDHSLGVQLGHWDETRGHWGIGTHGNNSNKTPMWLTTDLSTRTYGRASAVAAGFPAFERGVFFGNGGAVTRYQSYAQGAAPTSGNHGEGDIYWNKDAASGDPLGWVCVSGGNPGTWAEIRGVGNQTSGADQAALTNNTGGTGDGALSAVSGSGDDATINDNFTEVHALLAEVRSTLVDFGLMKGGA